MKLAIDLPIKYTGTEGVGDYCFVLASFLNLEHERCQEYTDGIRLARNLKMPIFMDNGAWEFGESVYPLKYLSAIMYIKPEFAIIPDVIKDIDRTLELADAFMELWKHEKPQRSIASTTKLFFAPQGKDYEEIKECYNTFVSRYHLNIYGIAIPKHVGKWANRVETVNKLYEDVDIKFEKVHFLGYNGINEFLGPKKRGKWILESLDTKWPMKMMLPTRALTQTAYYMNNENIVITELIEFTRRFKRSLVGRVEDL